MKKFTLLFFSIAFALNSFSQPISQLPHVTNITKDDFFVLVQNGVTKNATGQQILDFAASNFESAYLSDDLDSIYVKYKDEAWKGAPLGGTSGDSYWSFSGSVLTNLSADSVNIESVLNMKEKVFLNSDTLKHFKTTDPTPTVLTTLGVSGGMSELGYLTLPDLYNKMLDTVMAVPTSYTTLVRDSTKGVLYTATQSDWLGIGTNSPTEALEVNGNVKADTAKFTTYLNLPETSLTTGDFTSSATGISLSTTRQVIGGALSLSMTTGYSIPTTASQTNWTSAYNDKINSMAVTGTTTKTITLTQQDGGTVTANFTDISGTGGIVWSSVPATKTSTGTAGDIAYDANYLYICTATNTWKRTLLSTNW